jgi:hypothetical protein
MLAGLPHLRREENLEGRGSPEGEDGGVVGHVDDGDGNGDLGSDD